MLFAARSNVFPDTVENRRFRSLRGFHVLRGGRGLRSVAIQDARKSLHLQIGAAQDLKSVSFLGAGKLKASAGYDDRFVGAGIVDGAETRAIVGRQGTGRLKFEMGTMRVVRWAVMSARCFDELRGAYRSQSNHREQNQQAFHLQSPRGEHNLICRGGSSYCQSVGLLPPRLCGYFRAQGPRGQYGMSATEFCNRGHVFNHALEHACWLQGRVSDMTKAREERRGKELRFQSRQ